MKGKQHIEGIYKCYECSWGTNSHVAYIRHVQFLEHKKLYVNGSLTAVHASETRNELFGRGLNPEQIDERCKKGEELVVDKND